MDVAARLKELRERAKLSQAELARRARVGQGSISAIEAGKQSPTTDTLVAVCNTLGISLAQFFGEEKTGNVAERLKLCREGAGLSQYKLAKLAGVSQSFISDIEAGQKEPTLAFLRKLCEATGLSLPDFFAGTLPGRTGRYVVPELEELSPTQQKLLAEFIRSLKQEP